MESGAIDARAIGMRFGPSGAEQTVLDALDLTVGAGRFVTLLGPSGCGKSTLLKILGGILAPSQGTVSIEGRPAVQAVKESKIGFVPQRPALLPWKTALDNVKTLRQIASTGDSAVALTEASEAALETVGLSPARNKYPHELSGGMAQRVSIARALAMEPSMLLMDEPFGALDAITRDDMNERLADIWSTTRKTVVFVTHSISEALFLSDTVHVMGTDPGRIIESIDIDLVRPRTPDVFDSKTFSDRSKHLRGLLAPKVAV